jgi:F0F1-type ATP synthase membrane subunit b/b'
MSLDIKRLIEAEKEAGRLVEEANVEARLIRRDGEKEIAHLIEVSDRDGASLRRRIEAEFDQERDRLRRESEARILEAAAAVRSALSARKQAAVEEVLGELMR